jgi:hypothetical protein
MKNAKERFEEIKKLIDCDMIPEDAKCVYGLITAQEKNFLPLVLN